jgi:antitoxin HicB
MVSRTVDEYLVLPFTIEVYRYDSDGEAGYVSRITELPGCLTQADTFEELGEMIEDAMRAWIETALEDGQPIPEPRPMLELALDEAGWRDIIHCWTPQASS